MSTHHQVRCSKMRFAALRFMDLDLGLAISFDNMKLLL